MTRLALHRLPMSPLSAIGLLGACTAVTFGCDSCGCHAPPELGDVHTGWSVGLYEQVTWFDTAKNEGEGVTNTFGQWEHSATTQAIIDYRFNDDLSVTAFIPYISRSYRRIGNATPGNADPTETGTVAGLGDSSVLVSYRPWYYQTADASAHATLLAGVKAPTGDASQLEGEEPNSTVGDQNDDSLIGGHDLALGDGAWDLQLGANVIGRLDRWFAVAHVFYVYHTEGAYFYRFANELSGGISVGYLLQMEARSHVGLQLNLSGDSKGHDWVAGQETPDTANHNVFIGPELTVLWNSELTAMVGFDIPIYEHNSDAQLVPTWKIRGAIGWRF